MTTGIRVAAYPKVRLQNFQPGHHAAPTDKGRAVPGPGNQGTQDTKTKTTNHQPARGDTTFHRKYCSGAAYFNRYNTL